MTVSIGRDFLGIMHLPARIFELRGQGHDIQTDWIYEEDSNGVEHRNGLYVYLGKKEINNAKEQ